MAGFQPVYVAHTRNLMHTRCLTFHALLHSTHGSTSLQWVFWVTLPDCLMHLFLQVRVGNSPERKCPPTLPISGAANLECPSSHPHPTTTSTPLRTWRSSFTICIRCVHCLKLTLWLGKLDVQAVPRMFVSASHDNHNVHHMWQKNPDCLETHSICWALEVGCTQPQQDSQRCSKAADYASLDLLSIRACVQLVVVPEQDMKELAWRCAACG